MSIIVAVNTFMILDGELDQILLVHSSALNG